MSYRLAADLVVLVHFAFIVFVVLGWALVLRRPRAAWLHVPAVAWAVVLEYAGLTCPLTPLEVALRHSAGEAGYAGGFIAHYLLPILYPSGLTPAVQVVLGSLVLVSNVAAYGLLVGRALSARRARLREGRAG